MAAVPATTSRPSTKESFIDVGLRLVTLSRFSHTHILALGSLALAAHVESRLPTRSVGRYRITTNLPGKKKSIMIASAAGHRCSGGLRLFVGAYHRYCKLLAVDKPYRLPVTTFVMRISYLSLFFFMYYCIV